jgi:hypothetical protein
MVRILAMNCLQSPFEPKLSDDDIEDMKASSKIPLAFPIHTLGVEQASKLASEATRNSYV